MQHEAREEPTVDRAFMAKLWVRDIAERKSRERMVNNRRGSKVASAPGGMMSSQEYSTLKQPPLSQAATGYLKPTSPEEVQFVLFS